MRVNRELKVAPSVGDRRDVHEGQSELKLTLHPIYDFLASFGCSVTKLIGHAVNSTFFSGSLPEEETIIADNDATRSEFHLRTLRTLRTCQAVAGSALFRQSRQSCTVLSVMLNAARCNQLLGRFCKSR